MTEKKKSILIIDDEEMVREGFRDILQDAQFSIVEAGSGNEGIHILGRKKISAVLLDLNMPDMHGLEVLKEIKMADPDVPILIVTGHGDIPSAVEATRHGAFDFIIKPPDFDQLILTLKRAIKEIEIKKELKRLTNFVDASLQYLLGKSDTAKKIIYEIQHVAKSNFSVIIQGETGTGKSFLARMIHNISLRSQQPFVKVDVATLSENLIESELFGHEKGAFTGAEKKKKGFFEIANGGTIFIDELENMTTAAQTKFLSVIEEKEIYPVGSSKPTELDIRIIAATNTNLEESLLQNKIRKDLYYRLNEYIISIPPLRERREDILFFTMKFLMEASEELNKSIPEITPDAMNLLQSSPWPGNIRELKNVIRKAVLFCDGGNIHSEEIKSLIEKKYIDESPSADLPLKRALKKQEMKSILQALRLTHGNKTKAASLLGISARGLFAKVKEHKLS